MAEVQNVSAAVAATVTTAAIMATAADIPVTGDGVVGVSVELGTSPTQERSSNSHLHDSEYDTASDLEEDYDDDDDDDDLEDDDEDDGESLSDVSDEEDDGESGRGAQEKADAEAQKKVDEDRSNPQYIPKRGTFYEHDDRTAEGEPDGAVASAGQESGALHDGVAGGVGSAAAGARSPQSPTISAASKTMKKWQPASGVERWSHDRFDASEQTPKTRSELVNAYGYDIRTEDAPPRARRRRRYGRGPSKYSRNWEDETAYLKASNKERKPPRPSDFPALNERGPKPSGRRILRGGIRDEKENRGLERRQASGGGGVNNSYGGGAGERERERSDTPPRNFYPDEKRERPDGRSSGTGHRNKSFGNRGGAAPNASVGRQAAMEFKQKQQQQQRSGQMNTSTNSNNAAASNSLNSRLDVVSSNQHNTQRQNRGAHNVNNGGGSGVERSTGGKSQMQSRHEGYNNIGSANSSSNSHAAAYQQQQQQLQQQSAPSQQQSISMQRQQQHQQQHQQQVTPPKVMPPSNLSQRLQQVQQRNDPSHVGSVQMHALATQNQMVGQQQQLTQPQAAAAMIHASQQLPPQEQRGGGGGHPKRYSTIRNSRTQHENQHLAEQQQQHQLQQLHLQQPPPPSQLLLQEQHMLQANLMQLYHQENIQAQMQALQVSQAAPNAGVVQSKTGAYALPPPVTAQPPPPQAYGASAGPAAIGAPPTAYYVTAAAPADAYAATANSAGAQAPAQAQYAPQQPPPNYLPQTAPNVVAQQSVLPGGAATTNAYVNAPPASVVGAPPPSSTAAVVGVGAAVPQPASSNANPGGNYYNTVGGTTYFVPPAQPTARPVVLPQRRPTNAIPILPPSEKGKRGVGSTDAKDDSKTSMALGSAENIDHIIDNMFVQRPAFQPVLVSATNAAATANKSVTPPPSVDGVAVNKMSANNPQTDDGTPAVSSSPASTILEKTSSSSSVGGGGGGCATAIESAPIENNTNPIAAQE